MTRLPSIIAASVSVSAPTTFYEVQQTKPASPVRLRFRLTAPDTERCTSSTHSDRLYSTHLCGVVLPPTSATNSHPACTKHNTKKKRAKKERDRFTRRPQCKILWYKTDGSMPFPGACTGLDAPLDCCLGYKLKISGARFTLC